MVHDLPKGLKALTHENFEPCVGEDFFIESDPAPISIRLERLVKLMNGPAFLTRAPFSAFWSTDFSVSLMFGTYALRNGAWGPHPVYVEPMHFFGDRRAYQSVFF
jgi:hypothetical protein